MDSTPGSIQTDPHHDVAVAPVAAQDSGSAVEDALSQLARRAARDIPDPQTRTEGDDIVVVPQAAEPSVLVTVSNVCTVPQAAEPSELVTASNVSAVPQAAEPSVRATASNVSAVPHVAESPVRPTASDIFVGPQVREPSVLAEVRPAEFRNVPFPSEKPPLTRRATRAVIRFLIAVCVGVAGSLAWQSYGGAAREMIASKVPQLAWISSRPVMNQIPGPAASTGQAASSPAMEASAPQPAAAQAAPAQATADTPQAAAAPTAPIAQPATEQTAATMAAPTVPAAPSPDRPQLETMSRDIGALRQSVEQLAARQEQMTRDMAKLQAVEMSRHRMSALPPHPAAAPARRPPLPPQAPPQVSAAVPSALPPPPPPPPPRMSSERPPPAVPPQSAAPSQPAVVRPPMPVLGQP